MAPVREERFEALAREIHRILPTPALDAPAERTDLLCEFLPGRGPHPSFVFFAIFDVRRAGGAPERRVLGAADLGGGGPESARGPCWLPADHLAALLDALGRVRIVPGPRRNVRDGASFRLLVEGGDLRAEISSGDHGGARSDLAELAAQVEEHVGWWRRRPPGFP